MNMKFLTTGLASLWNRRSLGLFGNLDFVIGCFRAFVIIILVVIILVVIILIIILAIVRCIPLL